MPRNSSCSRFPGLHMAQRAGFTTSGGLSAVCSPPAETGRLPVEWVQRYRADVPRIVYVVLSFATPIAWVRDDGEVIIPDCCYSLTTSRHQRLCRIWL
ncbi:hypothetical protein ACFLIM_19720 [Nonomuraea sp. M3C6]|uniref:DUF8033 domain-containing protein n=1 Tax=Nonomuraea marmarensis TaxID=3351344 RepID=A0ABW7ADJ9_9ACTN